MHPSYPNLATVLPPIVEALSELDELGTWQIAAAECATRAIVHRGGNAPLRMLVAAREHRRLCFMGYWGDDGHRWVKPSDFDPQTRNPEASVSAMRPPGLVAAEILRRVVLRMQAIEQVVSAGLAARGAAERRKAMLVTLFSDTFGRGPVRGREEALFTGGARTDSPYLNWRVTIGYNGSLDLRLSTQSDQFVQELVALLARHTC
jgi:hypothetical protein